MTTNVTNATRRIAHLEAQARRAELAPMIAFVVESCALSPAAVIAEAETVLAATRGLTEAEARRWAADWIGITTEALEAGRAATVADFAAWQRERIGS